MKPSRVEIKMMDLPVMRDFIERVRDFVMEFAWHTRLCSAIDADGEWHVGNPACDCGYDEALATLVPDEFDRG